MSSEGDKFMEYDNFKSCLEIEIDRGKGTSRIPFFVILKKSSSDIVSFIIIF